MKKIITAAAVAALSIAAFSGAADASNAKSPTEFQSMIEKIHAKQARQRADIKVMIRANKASNPMSTVEFQKMIEKIHTRQAAQRAKIKGIVGVARTIKDKNPEEHETNTKS